MRSRWKILSAALLLGACASDGPVLEPAPRADQVVRRTSAAEETDGGTRVIVQPAALGAEAERDDVTTLRVTLEHDGERPLDVEHSDFALQGMREYAALPRGRVAESDGDISAALPEGPLEPGDRITGNVYFERVDDDEQDVQFRARIGSPETDYEVVTVSIPFMVIPTS